MGRKMLTRTLEAELREAATQFPAVTLTGPRQSGKTTLVRAVFPGHRYVSLERPDTREFASTDPRGFLSHYGDSVIFDEVQRVPELLSYIQVSIDESPDVMGRFILTGSQNFSMLDHVAQSLAGRTALFKLLPFSLAELEQRQPLDLHDLGGGDGHGDASIERAAPGRSLFDVLHAGFYPPIYHRGIAPRRWLASYYETYIERDVRMVINVGEIETFSRFVRLCAGRSGQLLNVSALASDAGVSHTTAKRWLSVLEASYIVYLLRPYHRNFGKRLVKSPKLYFLDSGLLCYLLNIRSPEELVHRAERGAIFESFVLAEFLKNFFHKGEQPSVFFWRDSVGHEIDFVLELGQRLIAVEIKSGQTVASDFFKNLTYWRRLAGDQVRTVLFYGGSEMQVRSEAVVYPWYFL